MSNRPIQREHILQVHAKTFCRDAIPVYHKFLSHDRAKAEGRYSHARQAARGIERGTADSSLKVADIPTIWCEWKAPGVSLHPVNDAAQVDFGQSRIKLGEYWFWTNSIVEYFERIRALGVPLRNNAGWLAEHYHAAVLGIIARAEMNRGQLPKQYKVREEKPSPVQVRRTNAVRGRILF